MLIHKSVSAVNCTLAPIKGELKDHSNQWLTTKPGVPMARYQLIEVKFEKFSDYRNQRLTTDPGVPAARFKPTKVKF